VATISFIMILKVLMERGLAKGAGEAAKALLVGRRLVEGGRVEL
jgi:hypothetical protein